MIIGNLLNILNKKFKDLMNNRLETSIKALMSLFRSYRRGEMSSNKLLLRSTLRKKTKFCQRTRFWTRTQMRSHPSR